MVYLVDGSKVSIHRNAGAFVVEHNSREGVLLDSMNCDTFAEAQAALAYGPSRW